MLSELCVRRPVFATMLVMSLVVLGTFSFQRLGVDLFPEADPATVSVEHPTAGRLDLVGSPMWGATRTNPTPPPLLGEHTREVLAELGRSTEQVDALAARGIVGVVT